MTDYELDDGIYKQIRQLEVGDVIPAGTLVLLSAGEYSSYQVIGLFRATVDTVVPGTKKKYGKPDEQTADTAKLSTLLEEVPLVEVWHEEY